MRCQACGREAPTKYVEFYQNIGMLVVRQMKSIKGNLCKRCARKYFWKLTGLTLVTGWWGTISVIMNPFLVINNVVRYTMCLGLKDGDPVGAGSGGALQVTAGNAVRGNMGAGGGGVKPADVPVAAIAPTGLAAYRSDILMRLRGGQTVQEIAAYVGPRAGVSVQAAAAYAESLKGATTT